MATTKSALRRTWNTKSDQYERAQAELLRILREVIADLSEDYKVRPVPFIHGDCKTFDSFYDKAMRYEGEERVSNAAECFKEIKDIARARVICQTLADVEKIKRLLEDNQALDIASDPQIHKGEERGYRGIHMDVEVNATVGGQQVATICEVQIHTAVQFAWSLYTHKDFYKGEGVPDFVQDLMRELSDLLNVADKVAQTLIVEVEGSATGTASPQGNGDT